MFAAMDTQDHLFDNSSIPSSQRKKARRRVKNNFALVSTQAEDGFSNPFSKRKERMIKIAEYYRRENERLRRPCPTCQTLVKPELQRQHNEAYHSKKA